MAAPKPIFLPKAAAAARACARQRCRRCSGSRRSARATTTGGRRVRCRAATGAAWWRPRSWARSIARCFGRIERSGYDVFSRVVRIPRPRRARHRRGHLGPNRSPAVTSRSDVIVIGGGFAGLSAACALSGAARRCWCSTRGRSSAGARPRFAIARPASWSTTASTCCSAAIARRWRSWRRSAHRIGCGRSRRWSSCASIGSGADPCFDVRRCRRRCTCWPACSRGPPIPWSERLGALRLALPLLRARRQFVRLRRSRSIRRNVTVQQWLDYHGQGRTLQEWLWHPLAVAA